MTANATPANDALSKLSVAAGDIKLAHSVFALPFAVLAAFMAAEHAGTGEGEPGGIAWARFAGQLGLVVVCMVFARTWAMLVNRLADRELDAANPRTARRAFASGRLAARDGVVMLSGSGLGFVAVCALFGVLFANWWPTVFSVPVLAWIGFYSFTKRFTALCHLVLGVALALSPVAAGVAVGGIEMTLLPDGAAVLLLSAMVACWVAGFDIIYALQDLDHDREAGLHSVPSKLGARGAIWLSRVLHAVCFAALVGVAVADPRFGVLFGAGVGLTGALLVAEHAVLARRGKAGLDMAFFTLNGVISVVLGLVGVVDVLL